MLVRLIFIFSLLPRATFQVGVTITSAGLCHAVLHIPWHTSRIAVQPVVTAALPTTHIQVLRRFGTFQRIQLQPPLPVEGLAVAALEAQEVLGHWQARAAASG